MQDTPGRQDADLHPPRFIKLIPFRFTSSFAVPVIFLLFTSTPLPKTHSPTRRQDSLKPSSALSILGKPPFPCHCFLQAHRLPPHCQCARCSCLSVAFSLRASHCDSNSGSHDGRGKREHLSICYRPRLCPLGTRQSPRLVSAALLCTVSSHSPLFALPHASSSARLSFTSLVPSPIYRLFLLLP